jgi:uncharacterized membrane protein YphA (DoxX/SURF4 family)
MSQSGLALVEWTPIKKQAFRFFFIFFILYIFLTPNDIVPYSHILHKFYLQPCTNLIAWLSKDIFHIAGSAVKFINGTTDTVFGYLTILIIFSVALMGSAIWMLIDRPARNYNKLYAALIVILRYYLAITWIAYGSMKIIQLQFPPLTPAALLQTYGGSTPRGLAWTFMGYSAGYNYFIGFTEYAIGLLLFFRRTSALGSLLAFVALANIMAFNYCFDVDVKLLSTVLMVMTLFLLSKYMVRLINFFWLNKVVYPEDAAPYNFKNKWKNKTLLIFKVALILYVIFFDLYGDFARAKQNGGGVNKPPLYGIYNVKTFIHNKDTVKPLTTDTIRWNKLIVSSIPGNAGVMLMNDSLKYFAFDLDTFKKEIVMHSEKDTLDKYTFTYSQPGADLLVILGKWHNDSLKINLQKYDLNKFLLVNRSFRWIVDHQIKIKR